MMKRLTEQVMNPMRPEALIIANVPQSQSPTPHFFEFIANP